MSSPAAKIYEWGKAAAVVAGAVSTLFVFASGAMQKINAVPKMQEDSRQLEHRVSTVEAKIDFLVEGVGVMTGRRYPRERASR